MVSRKNGGLNLLVIDCVALLFILDGADFLIDSVTLLFPASRALHLVLGLLEGGALLLGHLATVWSVADTALGV